MTKEFIEKIQNEILKFVPEGNKLSLSVIFEDCCSELSRLVASWILEADESTHQVILKGDDVCGTNKSHDILAIKEGGKIYLIDPTIWQFFPDEKSILIGESNSIDEAITLASKKYGGQWKISEALSEVSEKEKVEYQDVVLKNINENKK